MVLIKSRLEMRLWLCRGAAPVTAGRLSADPAEEPFVRLPARTRLELTPATNEAWYHVQALSHNPRLRATLPLQYRLRTLALALERRWRTDAERAVSSAQPAARGGGSYMDRAGTSGFRG